LSRSRGGPRQVAVEKLHASAALLALVVFLSGCATRGGDIPYAPEAFPVASFEPQGQLDQEIPLGPLDVIEVSVFRVADLSGTYQVSANGLLDLPLIGTVDARGVGASELARKLEAAYGSRFLKDPQIGVRVTDSGQQNVTVEGGVNAPGVYPVRGSASLLTVLALAKGVDVQNGNPRRVAIFRKSGGQTLAAAFDVIDIRRGKMVNPTVYPGDTIVVDGAGVRAIYRDIIQAIPAVAIFNSL
jgi:polysaccharide export outer membrane protein